MGSLSGRVRFVPAAIYASTVRVLLYMYASGVKARQLSWKLHTAWTAD